MPILKGLPKHLVNRLPTLLLQINTAQCRTTEFCKPKLWQYYRSLNNNNLLCMTRVDWKREQMFTQFSNHNHLEQTPLTSEFAQIPLDISLASHIIQSSKTELNFWFLNIIPIYSTIISLYTFQSSSQPSQNHPLYNCLWLAQFQQPKLDIFLIWNQSYRY